MWGISRGVPTGRIAARSAVWLAAGAAACVAACPAAGAVQAPLTASGAPRIVSLSPHITELLFAAGAGARIVGVDDASDYPPAARQIPRLGEVTTLDVEGLLRLAPSLIILWQTGTPPRVRAELDRLHLRVLVTEQRKLDDIAQALVEFGRLAGTSPAADDAARRYRAELAELRARYAGRARLEVFYQVWDRPLYTLSGEHVVSEALALCGGKNIFAELTPLAPIVDREAVLARNPDVILIGANGPDGARQAADWKQFPNLRAVRDRHVFTVDPSLVGRMSPRILGGVREVCSALDAARADHPVSNKRHSPDDILQR
ncbi:MAG TPA: cobalamin-binding protein [Steroidobacteraceae bacterium]|nr:cobalamin-binding protein [Steroidobacteraceae bacterium]